MRCDVLKRLLRLVLPMLLVFKNHSYANEIIFSRLSINDGLRSNFVNCVWQDQKGFIWVGTQSGLQRYDGNRFVQVYSQTDQSLPILPVEQIVGDGHHNMWLNLGRIVGRFDLKTNLFIAANLSGLPDAGRTLYVDSKGNVILVLFGLNVYKYNPKNNKFESWDALKIPKEWGVLKLFEDTKTGNYIISGKAGLGICDVKHQKFYHDNYNPFHLPLLDKKLGTSIVNVFIDSHRRYWIIKWPPGMGCEFFCYDENSGQLSKHDTERDFLGYWEILNINEINGQVFIAGENIFNVFNEATGRFSKFYDRSNTAYGIRFNLIKQVYGDADNNIWVANDNGLYMATNTRNRIRHGQLPTTNTDITDIQQVSTGNLLISTWGLGIFPFKVGNDDLSIFFDSLLKSQIHKASPANMGNYMANWCIAENSFTHHVFIGCQAGIVIDYDAAGKTSTFINNQAVFKNSTVRAIAEDKGHNMWFGSQSGKLIVKTTTGNYEFVTDLGWRIIKILVDERGYLWLLTSGKGIVIFDPVIRKVVKTYGEGADAAKSLSTNFINDVVRVNDSLYAIACSENLDILNIKTGTVKKLTVYNGLPQPFISCIITDKDGELWMATNSGIARYNFKTKTFRVYDQKDGLISTTDSKNLLYKVCRLRTGELAFAGGNTFIVFDPDALHEQGRPKDVTLTDFRLFNTYLNPDSVLAKGKLVLPHDQNAITIGFASLSYTQRNKLIYYYRLQGGGKSWIKAEGSLTASYASLAPGHYTFMVKCISPEGLAAPHITKLDIDIVPAFWQKWWFVLLLFIAASTPFYFIYKLRLKRLLAVQRLREKVARDLHDDMGSTLTSIGILSEMANVKMQGENSVSKDYLTRISANSSQMMDAMDDIVWSINPANDTMPKIIGRMREYAATMLEPRDIDYTVVNDDKLKTVKLDMDVRRSVFLIYKEALNNLVKYAQPTEVQIEFTISHGTLLLTIKDNGKGFDEKDIVYGNGLTNMRKRAENMGGKLRIRSQKDLGTTICLQIPLT